MPNRAVHDVAGTASGALFAVLRAGNQSNPQIFLESLGGCIGGFAASRLPDIIDPPICPNHRDVGHSIVVVGGVYVAVWKGLNNTQQALRAHAEQLATRRETSNSMSDFKKFLSQCVEAICYILAGVISGAIAGYVSHLALDAGSARGLPLLCKAL